MSYCVDRVVKVFNYNYKIIILMICFVMFLGVCFFSRFNNTGKVSASTSNQKYFVCIDIEEGDTLWSIADTYISEEYSSLDEYVEEIMELNALTDDKIYCGATLVVPYYAP